MFENVLLIFCHTVCNGHKNITPHLYWSAKSVDPAVDLFTHFPSFVSCLPSSGGHFDISYLLLSRLVVVPPATRQRKVKVEKRRREFTMLLQYKSLHVTTFTNPCNKFEKSFTNLTSHTSTRQ